MILLMELSGANPLTEFQAWFFGSMAVLFTALLIYNVVEMKSSIRTLTGKSINYERDLELLKQSTTTARDKTNEHEKWIKEHEKTMRQVNENLTRLNMTLQLLTRDTK